jgi:DNA-binding NtrC family response regulator
MMIVARPTATRVAPRQTPAEKLTCISPTNPNLGILSVSAAPEDHTIVRQSVSGISCSLQTAEDCRSALEHLGNRRIAVVVCERELPDGTWRDILEHLGSAPGRPLLIVISRVADDRLWAEVLNMGGYDVLAKPLNAEEARHVLMTACLGRRHGAYVQAAGPGN